MPAGGLSMVRKHPSGWKSNRSTTAMRVAAVVCVIMALTTADEKFTPAYYYREQTLTTPRRYTGT